MSSQPNRLSAFQPEYAGNLPSVGEFEYITAPMNAEGEDLLSLATVVQAKVIQEYGNETHTLNIVAITDGARAIRNRLSAIFSVTVTVILDWYHLCKKLRQLMSMIAVSGAEKMIHLKFLIPQLWLGLVDNALEYLRKQVTVKNQQKWLELIGYLEKHRSEIINFSTIFNSHLVYFLEVDEKQAAPMKTSKKGRQEIDFQLLLFYC